MRQVEQRSDPLAGMGGAGPDPAALLRLLLTYGRLEEAAALAVSYLDYWDKQARIEAIWDGDGGTYSASLWHLTCCCTGLSSIGLAKEQHQPPFQPLNELFCCLPSGLRCAHPG